MDAIIDRFGEDFDTFEYDTELFRAVVNVAVSHVFYSWVFGFEGKVRIEWPKEVKLAYSEMIEKVYEKLCG